MGSPDGSGVPCGQRGTKIQDGAIIPSFSASRGVLKEMAWGETASSGASQHLSQRYNTKVFGDGELQGFRKSFAPR